ncbi:36465_t:CDS:2, partial [Gigaspora margarita]
MPRNKGTFWDGFEKIVNKKGQERWKCKVCNNSWVKNETRIQEHYNHCNLKNSNNSNTLSSTSSSTSSFFTNADQKELESLLARGFYSAGISFNILENDDIKAFFLRALPYFKLPTRYSLSNSLLTKEYSGLNTDSIINYMITTPKPLFYKSVHTKEDQHTAQNIAEGIDKVMQELGIDKFVAVITDNAPNMKAAWRILKNQYPTKVFLGCWAHGINLWIKDILKLDWPKTALRRLQIEKYGHIISLVQTVDTRWGSAFYCMDHLLQTKNAIRSLLIEESIGISPSIKIHLMNDFFGQDLRHLRDFLEPFVKFIHELEGDVPLLSVAFFKLRQLETKIRNNNYIPTIVITESIRLVEHRWNDSLYNPATMAAYKLDPRYCGEILDPNKWDAPIERELIRLAGPENGDQLLEELSEYVGKTDGFSANYLWGSIKEKPYNWWNLVKARYPVLSSIALKLLSIPASSASSERNWSSFNFVHSKLRNRLHNPRVEKIVYIYWNLRILRSLKWPLSVKELKNRGYLIEDDAVNLELNETNSVEENNINVFLSDSPSYNTDEIDNMDINEIIDDLDSIDNMSNIDNTD